MGAGCDRGGGGGAPPCTHWLEQKSNSVQNEYTDVKPTCMRDCPTISNQVLCARGKKSNEACVCVCVFFCAHACECVRDRKPLKAL